MKDHMATTMQPSTAKVTIPDKNKSNIPNETPVLGHRCRNPQLLLLEGDTWNEDANGVEIEETPD